MPYGAGRYASGSLPTARGYTGQYQDTTSSGLDYYGARYYDPILGQFTSADTVLAGGLNRYAYVHGNPTTAADPSGHHAAVCESPSCDGGPNFQGGPEGGNGEGGNGSVGSWATSGDGEGGDAALGLPFSDDITGDPVAETGDGVYNAAPGLEGDYTGDYVNGGELNDAGWNVGPGDGEGGGNGAGDGTLSNGAGDGTPSTPSNGNGSGDGAGDGTPSSGGNGDGGGDGSWGPSTPQGPTNTQPGSSEGQQPDLFRNGNAQGPRIDNVRVGKDVFPDANNQIDPSQLGPNGETQGVSTTSTPQAGKYWWRLPSGSRLPTGLQAINDHGAHWAVQPGYPMSVDEFRALLGQIQGWIRTW